MVRYFIYSLYHLLLKMANPGLVTQMGHVAPDAAPLSINELIDLLNTVLQSTFAPGVTYSPYVISHVEPAVNDRDKAWIYIDTQGKPIEIRLYHANTSGWRRLYNGMPNEIRIYSGNPGYSDNPLHDFDINGHGHVLGTYDGWQLCNGKNGAPDFSDKFVLAAHMNNANGIPGYDHGWQGVIDGVAHKDGGQWTETLLPQNIPFPTKGATGVTVGKYTAEGNAPAGDGDLFGLINGFPVTLPVEGADPGNPHPLPVFVGPPFIAMGYIIFQGY